MKYIEDIPYEWRIVIYIFFSSLFLCYISGGNVGGAFCVINIGIFLSLKWGMETIMQFIKLHLTKEGKEIVNSGLVHRFLISEKDPMCFLGPIIVLGILFGLCVGDIRILIAGLFELVLIFFMIRDLLYYHLYE